jgi:hypothetical protein
MQSVAVRRDRPALVWLIAILYGLGCVHVLHKLYQVHVCPLPGGSNPMFIRRHAVDCVFALTELDTVLSMVLAWVGLAAVLTLLLMRRGAAYLFTVNAVLGLAIVAGNLFSTSGLGELTGGWPVAAWLMWAVSVAACVYTWTLVRQKMLV